MFNLFKFDFLKKKTTPRLLGLAIGSSSVKLLELSKSQNQYCVENYAIVPITQTIPEAIKQAIALSGTQLRCAAIAMPDSEVISKSIQMNDSLSPDEMEEIILADADKHTHYPLHEISLDFEILGPTTNKSQLVDVLLIAARTEKVNERIALVHAAGLNVNIVDVQSHALERAHTFITAPEETFMIIDIGKSAIKTMVLYQQKIIFSRSDDMQKNSNILIYIERALHFFFSSPQRQEITHMLLMGGGSYIEDLCLLLETQLSIPTSIANPFSMMSVSSKIDTAALTHDARLMMTSCGLALRSFPS
jgi:type IV pilus assembly protein PilM